MFLHVVLVFHRKETPSAKTYPLIKRLLSNVNVCCRLLSGRLLVFNVIKKTYFLLYGEVGLPSPGCKLARSFSQNKKKDLSTSAVEKKCHKTRFFQPLIRCSLLFSHFEAKAGQFSLETPQLAKFQQNGNSCFFIFIMVVADIKCRRLFVARQRPHYNPFISS